MSMRITDIVAKAQDLNVMRTRESRVMVLDFDSFESALSFEAWCNENRIALDPEGCLGNRVTLYTT